MQPKVVRTIRLNISVDNLCESLVHSEIYSVNFES